MPTFKSSNIIWIHGYQRIWRIAFLVLLVVAMNGPWLFDVTWVPPPYFCRQPHIRLDENFCGLPYSLTSFLPTFSRDLKNLAVGLFTEGMDPMGLLFALFLILLLLPFLSTLVLTLRGACRRWQKWQMALLGLASTASTLIALLRLHWALWGIWLYIWAVASMLLLEALMLVTDRRRIHD